MAFIHSLLGVLMSAIVYLTSGKLPNKRTQPIVRSIALLIGILASASAVFRNVTIISTGQVGVEELFGHVNPQPLNPGVHLTNPFSDMTKLPTRLQDLKETIEVTSKEGLTFQMDVSLQYKLQPEKAVEVYRAIGTDADEIITSRFRSIVREITAMYPVEAIYATKRREVASQLHQRMTTTLSPLGFSVEETLLRQVVLPETLQAAVQQKLKTEQESQQMKFTLEKARQEAERKRVEAQGIADAQRIVSQSLTDQTLKLRAIEATEKLATSTNTKLLILGNSQGSPLSLQLDETAVMPKP